MPTVEQVELIRATLSAHIERQPLTPHVAHARWTWTRGKLRAASGGRSQPPLVPWTSERLNTSPGTYGWLADRAFIDVNMSGMYVVACAVFVPAAGCADSASVGF